MDHWRNEFISTKEKARRMARRIRPYLSADENGDLVSRVRSDRRWGRFCDGSGTPVGLSLAPACLQSSSAELACPRVLSAVERPDRAARPRRMQKRMGPRFKVEMEQGLLGRDNGVTILGRFQTGKRAKDADELLDRVRSTCRVDVSAVMRYRATIMKQASSRN